MQRRAANSPKSHGNARAWIIEPIRRWSMHDDKSWLRRPVLPRPPALPHFGPEMRALIGLDPSELEKDAISSPLNAAPVETSEPDSSGDTYLEELVAVASDVSDVRVKRRLVRAGTY